jgi:hypothetical protein
VSTTPRISVPPSGSALTHVPALSDAFWKLYGALWSRGALDHRVKEIARIRNARTTNCGL